ncbi:hypothetical protein GCM10009765_23120 [Fodinicola feengrottensis]|uniref:Uncharacterized protein n=2 Tax=Fodinicola feengrottensis TaxID=435914 RepID=A0ABN2GLI2_9ACTN
MPNSPQQSPDDWTAELEKSKMKTILEVEAKMGREVNTRPHKDAVLPIHAIFERQLVGKGIPEYFPGTSEDDSPGRSLNAEQSDDPAVEALRPASRESGAPQTDTADQFSNFSPRDGYIPDEDDDYSDLR